MDVHYRYRIGGHSEWTGATRLAWRGGGVEAERSRHEVDRRLLDDARYRIGVQERCFRVRLIVLICTLDEQQ